MLFQCIVMGFSKAFSKLMSKVVSKATRATMKTIAKKGAIGLAEGAIGAGGAKAMSELIGEGRRRSRKNGSKGCLNGRRKRKSKPKRSLKPMIGKGIGGYVQGGQALFDVLAPETKWTQPTPSSAQEITRLKRYSKQLDQ